MLRAIKGKDLPLANMGYAVENNSLRLRATTKEAGHEKDTIFVGLDIHKDSIDIALANEGRDGDVRFYGTVDGDLDSLHKTIRKIQGAGCGAVLQFAYEAGPCGYEIYRSLTGNGFDCVVVAPSKIPRKSRDRIKNDRRDALNMASLHRSGKLTAVYVPGVEDEAMVTDYFTSIMIFS